MKPIHVQICLFDPATQEKFPVFDGVEVDIVRVEVDRLTLSAEYSDLPLELISDSKIKMFHAARPRINPLDLTDQYKPLKLIPHPEKKEVFHVDAPEYRVTSKHHIRVRFLKLNFSKQLKKLLAPDEIDSDSLPIYHPSRLPYWDTGWNDGYRRNKYFSSRDLRLKTTTEDPLILEIPIRRIYNIGHRGAPYSFPENTIDSFKKALELGANGLELDLCMTNDRKIVIFHDPTAVDLLSLNRTYLENFPFGLASPEIIITDSGVDAITKKLQGDQYIEVHREHLDTLNEYDMINLELDQIKEVYRYYDSQKEQLIPTLDEFLTEVVKKESKNNKLQFIYFDVKNPGWEETEKERFVEFGTLIGRALKQSAALPAKLVIGCTQSSMLQSLKEGIENAGETRCEYAYDAEGSLTAWLEPFPEGLLSDLLSRLLTRSKLWGTFLKILFRSVEFLRRVWLLVRQKLGCKSNNPLEQTQVMNNSAISIGCLGRPRSLEEIKQAISDRDYNTSTSIRSVIHYTLNSPAQMYQSITAGVNGVVTDKPDEFKRLLEKLGVIISYPKGKGEEHVQRSTDMIIHNCHAHVITLNNTPDRIYGGFQHFAMQHRWLRIALVYFLHLLKPFTDTDPYSRNANFISQGDKASQEEVLIDLMKYYPSDTKYVISSVDFDHMEAGEAPLNFEKQIQELAILKKKYPDHIYAFIGADPRRTNFLDLVKTYIETKDFKGIKLYPAFGFFPCDRELDPLYEYAEKNKVPILVHCKKKSRAYYKGEITDKMRTHPRTGQLLDIKPNEEFSGNWTDPDNYLYVLDDFKDLKICFAHFGGEIEWRKYQSPDSWYNKIKNILMNSKYPNTFADISYTLADFDLLPLLKTTLQIPQVREKVLFGSDFYYDLVECTEEKFSIEFRTKLGDADFWQIAETNPKRFLS